MALTLTALFAIALYAAGGVLLTQNIFSINGSALYSRTRLLGIGFGAAVLHAIVLGATIPAADGLHLGFFNALSLIAWFGVALLLLAALARPVENLGLFVLPLAALALGFDLVAPSDQVVLRAAPIGLKAHVLISILAYATLTIATIQAVLLAVQDRRLHRHRVTGLLGALPPIETLESLLFQIIGVGFALLTVSLATGFVFVENLFAQHLVHKTVLSITAWIVFGALLAGRVLRGWRGRTALRWTVAGFVVLMLAYFGSKLVLELILNKP